MKFHGIPLHQVLSSTLDVVLNSVVVLMTVAPPQLEFPFNRCKFKILVSNRDKYISREFHLLIKCNPN